MSAYQVGRCTCGSCLSKDEPSIFGTRGDAFVWGALAGATVILLALLVGRIVYQVFS